MTNELTAKKAKELFNYDPETGIITARVARHKIYVGQILGTDTSSGYLSISFDHFNYKAHRVIWLFVHGYMPKEIDHINGNKKDNRIKNLREVTRQQNCSNARVKPDKYKGVSERISGKYRFKRWRARIMVKSKDIALGYFLTAEEAAKAYNAAAIKHFGKFARLNEIQT